MNGGVLALGELLIDFTESGFSADGGRLFEQNPGGAPANLLVALRRLGTPAAFIGKVGRDMHGEFLRAVLSRAGVDTAGLVVDPDVFTTLAFVSIGPDGERDFSFARSPGADTCLRPQEVDPAAIAGADIFHVGSLSLTAEPARSATLFALETARRAGCLCSYDPNYRAPLWQSREQAQRQMRSLVPLVDVVKLSDAETALLTDCAAPEQAAATLLAQGVSLVAVTRGGSGASVYTARCAVDVPGFAVEAVDTTGAGDCFWGAFLHCLRAGKTHPRALSPEQMTRYARFANAAAALCVQRRGGISSMPDCAAVERLLTQESRS